MLPGSCRCKKANRNNSPVLDHVCFGLQGAARLCDDTYLRACGNLMTLCVELRNHNSEIELFETERVHMVASDAVS